MRFWIGAGATTSLLFRSTLQTKGAHFTKLWDSSKPTRCAGKTNTYRKLLMSQKTQTEQPKTVATNREAYHNYFILETYEAGVQLVGTEVKSARAGRVNLKDGYVTVRDGQAWLMNVQGPVLHNHAEETASVHTGVPICIHHWKGTGR